MAERQEFWIDPTFGRPDLRSCAVNLAFPDYRQSANRNHRLLSNP